MNDEGKLNSMVIDYEKVKVADVMEKDKRQGKVSTAEKEMTKKDGTPIDTTDDLFDEQIQLNSDLSAAAEKEDLTKFFKQPLHQ